MYHLTEEQVLQLAGLHRRMAHLVHPQAEHMQIVLEDWSAWLASVRASAHIVEEEVKDDVR